MKNKNIKILLIMITIENRHSIAWNRNRRKGDI